MRRIALVAGLIGFCCAAYAQSPQPGQLMVQKQGAGLFFWYSYKKTDTRDYLAKRYYVPADSIAKYNPGINWKEIKEKTQVKMPVLLTNFSTTKKGTATDTMIALHHTVAPKEGLWSISKAHHQVPVENIKIWNNLAGDNVTVGSNIIVGYVRRRRIASGPPGSINVPLTKVSTKDSLAVKKPSAAKPASNKKPAIDTALSKIKPATHLAAESKLKDSLQKKEEPPVVKQAPFNDTLIIKKQLPDSAARVADAVYIKKAPLLRNRVNFIMKLSYVNSVFGGKDAMNSTYLLKNSSGFEVRDPGGKNRINGFSGGLGIENKIGMRLSLQTEILYERKGADIKIDSAQSVPDKLSGDMRVRLNYLSFAFLPKLNFGKKTVFYLYGGVYGGFLMRSVIEGEAVLKSNIGTSSISVNDVNSRRFNKADLGYATGLGLKFSYKKTKRQHFILEGRYSQSFTSISNEEINNKVPEILNRAFYITVAYEFNR